MSSWPAPLSNPCRTLACTLWGSRPRIGLGAVATRWDFLVESHTFPPVACRGPIPPPSYCPGPPPVQLSFPLTLPLSLSTYCLPEHSRQLSVLVVCCLSLQERQLSIARRRKLRSVVSSFSACPPHPPTSFPSLSLHPTAASSQYALSPARRRHVCRRPSVSLVAAIRPG